MSLPAPPCGSIRGLEMHGSACDFVGDDDSAAVLKLEEWWTVDVTRRHSRSYSLGRWHVIDLDFGIWFALLRYQRF